MENKEEFVENVIEKVLPRHFSFIIFESELGEDGSYTKMYSTRCQNLYEDLINLIEKYNGK